MFFNEKLKKGKLDFSLDLISGKKMNQKKIREFGRL
jgi:hypothetical protein